MESQKKNWNWKKWQQFSGTFEIVQRVFLLSVWSFKKHIKSGKIIAFIQKMQEQSKNSKRKKHKKENHQEVHLGFDWESNHFKYLDCLQVEF